MAVFLVTDVVLVLLFVAGPAFFARRNLRMGRGDRSGAARLVCVLIGLLGVAWVFGEHHVAKPAELELFVLSAALWLLLAGWLWLMYIALEPFVRRRWPGVLVGWSRLLAGNYRDPLVGRDLLVGCVMFAALSLLTCLSVLVRDLLGTPQPRPSAYGLGLFSGSHVIVAEILRNVAVSIIVGLAAAFTVFMLRVLLRSTWAAAIVITLLISLSEFAGTSSIISSVSLGLTVGIFLFVFFRFGLLALIATLLFFIIWASFPITTQLSAWYSGIGLTGLALLLAFALYAFHASLGGQPLFGRASLED